MTWDGFWWPNILQSTLFAAVSAVVVFAVGLVLRWWWKHWGHDWVRAWAADLLTEKLQPTQDAALVAASNARAAKTAADASAGDAKTAASNSSDAGSKLEIVGARLVDVIAENQGMAARLDDVLAAYLRLATIAQQAGIEIPPAARTPGFLIPTGAADIDDPITVTGRHRLHTQRLTVTDEGDPT